MFISLLTDFGEAQEYAGVMKAVILSVCPSATIVDISHSVPAYDVGEGAVMLRNFVVYAPVGVHVAVVDPGVGTERRGVAIETERGDYLVGPDNGVLMEAVDVLGFRRAVVLENEAYMLREVSPSFHGRDVFAPCAGYLAKGVLLKEFGRTARREELVKSPVPQVSEDEKAIHAHVLRIDRFGNVQLNVRGEKIQKKKVVLRIDDEELTLPVVKTFGDVKAGELLLYEDSDGLITIAQNRGNAAQFLGVERQAEVLILKRDAYKSDVES